MLRISTIAAIVSLMIVGAEDRPRTVKRIAAPPFDDLLVQARAEGEVVIKIEVTASGEVGDANVVETFWPPFNELLETYARMWLFEASQTSSTQDVVFVFKFIPEDASPADLGWRFFAPSTVEIRHTEPRRVLSTDPHPKLKRRDED